MVTRNRAVTKDHEAYQSLRNEILNNKYLPGEALREEELCLQMNITRTPLRLALRRLEQEQLVTNEPFCGCRIREVTTEELEPLFDIREVMEGLAARYVAARNNAQDIAVLRHIAENCDKAQKDQQWLSYFEHDKTFHRKLIEQAGNFKLTEIMEVYDFQLRTFSLHHRYLLHVVKELSARAQEFRRNHRDLVDALESGNAALAEEKFRHHVRGSKEMIMAACRHWRESQNSTPPLPKISGRQFNNAKN